MDYTELFRNEASKKEIEVSKYVWLLKYINKAPNIKLTCTYHKRALNKKSLIIIHH